MHDDNDDDDDDDGCGGGDGGVKRTVSFQTILILEFVMKSTILRFLPT